MKSKSKLFGVCATVLVCSAWWIGCSGSTTNGNNGTPDSGPAEGGGTPDATTGADTSTAPDAPADTGVDSSLTGPFIDIQFGAANCPAFAACGGDPKGVWNVTGGCVTEAVFDGAKAQCAGITETNVKFQARGNVTATAATIQRHTEVKFSATLAIPMACKQPVGSCAVVGQALVGLAGLETAMCTDDAGTGGCNCDVSDTILDNGPADAYTVAGNSLSTAGPPARTFDFCVNGNEIKYKETTAMAAPAIFVLTK